MRPHLASLVEDFRRHATETAVVAHRGNRRHATSYGALADLCGRFAAELDRRAILPGDRVVLWGENSAEWIAVFFGCLLRGVIAVPLDAAGTPDFAGRVIADVAPKLIVGDTELLAALHNTAPKLSLSIIADQLPSSPNFTVSSAVTLQTPFQIVFTSGTTSEPRGIVHTHRNVLVTLEPIEREMAKYLRYERIFHPLRFLHSLPLSHVFGQFMGLWIPALLAAEVHFSGQLEPARIVSLIRNERVSVLVAVPRVLSLLRAHLVAQYPGAGRSTLYVECSPLQATSAAPSQTDNVERRTVNVPPPTPSGLRGVVLRWWRFRRVHGVLGWKFWAVISGGATLPADLESFWQRLGFALIQGYGMTETAALVTLNHPFRIAPGTIGKPLPGREVRISDDGEILVRGDMLSTATWQRGAMQQREGEWLATGDLAERNATGDLRFLGRKGDVIVTAAGLNVHPADLEAALAAQPGIRAAAVVPCELANGTEPIAVVLIASNADLDSAVATANRTLADFQQIRRVLRWPELEFPYTSTGKLLRRQIAAWACAALSDRAAPSTKTTQDALLNLIAKANGEPIPASVEPDALRLSEDLHLDSLGRVQLQSALEQHFSIELDDDRLDAAQTVGELRRVLEGRVVSDQLSVVSLAPSSAELPAPETLQLRAVELTTDNRQPATEPHLYRRWPWTAPVRILRIAFLECILRPLVWLLAAPRVTYTVAARTQLTTDDRQPTTPFLIISNHITAYDGALILYALPGPLRRRVAAAMSGEMLLDMRRACNQGNALLNLLAPGAYVLLTALFNVFPLPRARGFRRSFAHAGEAMDRGYSVIIFPEGKRSRSGAMNPFRSGIGLLAQQSQVPILPIALAGLYDLTQPASGRQRFRWLHSGRIELRIGAPIPAPPPGSDPALIAAELERVVRALQTSPPA